MKYLIMLIAFSITQLTFGQVCLNTHFEDYPAGTIMTNQCEDIVISAQCNNGMQIAMIFDSENPTGGDPDLAVDLGKILIISEDGDQSDPDDANAGGIITFEFATPKYLDTLTLIDVEESGSCVRAYDQFGNMMDEILFTSDDCGCVRVDLYMFEVSRLEVEFLGSGAIDDFNYTDIPLAIDLTTFNVIDREGLHLLEWKVENQIDFGHFELQHSLDAYQWTTVGTLPGGAKEYHYEYVPMVGMNYYRLNMVNNDGSSEYSSVIQLRSDVDPFSQETILKDAKVFDVAGRMIPRGDEVAGILLIEYKGTIYKRAFLSNW